MDLKQYVPTLETAKAVEKLCGTPTFITDENEVTKRVEAFKNAFKSWPTKFFYAIKANYNPSLVKILKETGIHGIDTASMYEVELAMKLGFKADEIIFTGNGNSDEDMKSIHEKGVLLNIGSLSELERFGKMFPGREVAVRINPGQGAGEGEGVITAGEENKFGIRNVMFPRIIEIAKEYDLKIVGVHAHIGSGFYQTEQFENAVKVVLEDIRGQENIKFVDFGGGFGVRYHRGEKSLDLHNFYNSAEPHLKKYEEETGVKIEVRLEPGKFLVSEATAFLTKVNTIKNFPTKKFVSVNSGFNHLARPFFYDAYHHVENISNPTAKIEKCDIVGYVCESSDVFAENREIPSAKEGDFLAFLTAGGYGASMSSLYNLHPYATEVLLQKDGKLKVTRKKMSLNEMFSSLGYIE